MRKAKLLKQRDEEGGIENKSGAHSNSAKGRESFSSGLASSAICSSFLKVNGRLKLAGWC
jgi:hypothetical protein